MRKEYVNIPKEKVGGKGGGERQPQSAPGKLV